MCYTHNKKDWFSIDKTTTTSGLSSHIQTHWWSNIYLWLGFSAGNLEDDDKIITIITVTVIIIIIDAIITIILETIAGVKLIISGFYTSEVIWFLQPHSDGMSTSPTNNKK